MFGVNEFASALLHRACARSRPCSRWRCLRGGCGAGGGMAGGGRCSASMLLFRVHGTAADPGHELDVLHDGGARGLLVGADRADAFDASGIHSRGAPEERRWMLLPGLAAALGVLTKGLVAAAIPAGGAGRSTAPMRAISRRGAGCMRRSACRCSCDHRSLALACGAAAAGLPAVLLHPRALARYLTPSADREETWWFFAVVFLLGSAPWTLAGAAGSSSRDGGGARRRGYSIPRSSSGCGCCSCACSFRSPIRNSSPTSCRRCRRSPC